MEKKKDGEGRDNRHCDEPGKRNKVRVRGKFGLTGEVPTAADGSGNDADAARGSGVTPLPVTPFTR